MKEEAVTIPVDGSSVQLEGRLASQVEGITQATTAFLLTHPHPKFGGALHNNVVSALFQHLQNAPFCHSILRFNFRGVGRSTGHSSWRGWAEREDVIAAARFLMSQGATPPTRLIIIGYSFGSAVGCGVAQEIEACVATVAISYPAGWGASLLFSSHYSYIRQCPLPKLLLMGDRDNFTSISTFRSFVASIQEPKEVREIPGQDHMWFHNEQLIVEPILQWVETYATNQSIPQ